VRDSIFLSKARSVIIQKEQGKLLDSQGRLDRIKERLALLC